MQSIIQKERQLLNEAIAVLSSTCLSAFESYVSEVLGSSLSQEESLLVFSDSVDSLIRKINSLLPFKVQGLNVHQQLLKKIQFPEKQRDQGKKKFDLICNYKKRRQEAVNAKSLYSLETCKHLIFKTFKKTYHDAFDHLLPLLGRVQIPVDLVCLGGGPGSDLVGLLAALLSKGQTQFNCQIWDYNYQRWQILGENLQQTCKKEFKSLKKLSIEWKFLDFNQKCCAEKGRNKLFACCWALNQGQLNESFWTQIFSIFEKSYFFFVEGQSWPLEQLMKIAGQKRCCHRLYANPRSLFISTQ